MPQCRGVRGSRTEDAFESSQGPQGKRKGVLVRDQLSAGWTDGRLHEIASGAAHQHEINWFVAICSVDSWSWVAISQWVNVFTFDQLYSQLAMMSYTILVVPCHVHATDCVTCPDHGTLCSDLILQGI